MSDTIVNQYLKLTSDAVVNMMTDDKYDEHKRNDIMNILSIALRSENYVNSVKGQIRKINEDGKIDSKDIPYVLVIIADSKEYLSVTIQDTIALKSTLRLDSMKYIVFGVIYFVMLMEKVDPKILMDVKEHYSALWSLLEIDPKKLLIKADSCWRKCFPCCFKCSCCPTQSLEERWGSSV